MPCRIVLSVAVLFAIFLAPLQSQTNSKTDAKKPAAKEPAVPDGAVVKAWTAASPANKGLVTLEWFCWAKWPGELRTEQFPRAEYEKVLPHFRLVMSDLAAVDFKSLPDPKVPMGYHIFSARKGFADALKSLAAFPATAALEIGEVEAKAADYAALAAMKNLRILHLSGGYNQATRPPESVLKLLPELKELEYLGLHGMTLTAEGFASLKKLQTVKRLKLGANNIDDAAMKSVPELKNLEYVQIAFNDITDQSITILKECKNLKGLSLSAAKITDDGLKALAAYPKLVQLYLYNNKGLTEAAVDTLSQLKNLEYLNVGSTKITPAGIEKLRKALPKCEIPLN